ncbi:hypothetical protein A8924_1740 [Saccharopolyspora erythraea NRRL 2338]|uniref:Uncharacterized protein n=2 Tax=Saccharopolyspora erythraea TaxID=1836 RepID=A4F9E1_SACEN|nr:hypothetical protein [Saccharopolyspora erythraea]EQD82188.1 hypothetical protein N599_32050 [Saccharopolyspora erythraea D]PFG94454.1 hypothetical protein A8924_1740 [Saccharopolyspora erythraea NRRL 2338]QRK91211.1 hypothetical protein JQX30_07270 [Saccharopolyspora erythraea]CAM00666.1 hypothetical protein SACE_1343 [Saccharopolyspora erythraea NRRL 2338]
MIRVNEDDLDVDGSGRAWHQGQPFTGEEEDRLPDGTLISITTYANGRQEGPDREWYPDGTLKEEGNFSKGLPIGLHRAWRPDGTLARELEFSDEGLVIRRQGFDAEGNVTWQDAG